MALTTRLAAAVPPSLKTPRVLWRRKYRLLRHYGGSIRQPYGLRYVLLDPELDNFTYTLENEGEVAATIAAALGEEPARISAFMDEVTHDALLQDLPRNRLLQRGRPRYARRLGWYAAVRALRPELVVETGIHDGIGSALLLRALERNGTGELWSFDLHAHRGQRVPHELRGRWRMVIGSTRDTLQPTLLGREVDVFIHDSDHSYENERFELETALAHGADPVVLFTDNAHVTPALRELCDEHGVQLHLVHERPAKHFYPGATLGLGVFPRPR